MYQHILGLGCIQLELFQVIQELQSFKAADNVELMSATEAPICIRICIRYTVVASAKSTEVYVVRLKCPNQQCPTVTYIRMHSCIHLMQS